MNKWKESVAAKIIAWILITISGMTLLAGTVGAYMISELGLYTKSITDIRQEQFERIAGKYSALVLQNLNTGANEAYFKDTNFSYGVVEASDYETLQKLDLNEKNTYVETNFTGKVSLDKLHLFQCNLNEETSIYIDDSVFGGYNITHCTRDYDKKYINDYIYDTDTGIFYYEVSDVPTENLENATEIATEKWLYPAAAVKITVVDNSTGDATTYRYVYDTAEKMYAARKEMDSFDDMQAELCITIQSVKGTDENDFRNIKIALENAPLTFKNLDATPYSYGTSEWIAEIEFPQAQTMVEDQIVTFHGTESTVAAATAISSQSVNLSYEGTNMNKADEIMNRSDYDFSEPDVLYAVHGSDAGTDYYVLSLIPDADSLVKKEGVSIWGSDYFVQMNYLLNVADRMKYSIYVIIAVSLFLLAASLIYLVMAAGHRKGQEQITENALCRIPLDLYTGVILIAEYMLIVCMSILRDAANSDNYVFYVVAIIFLLLCGGWLALGYILNVAIRVKMGKWWKNTLVCKIFRGLHRGWNRLGENISILWKGLLIFVVVNFLEVAVFALFGLNYEKIMLVWLAEKAVILFAGAEILIQMKKLQDGGRHIADGDVEYQVDTEHMFQSLKEHGTNLNRINEGVSKAVNEKMKSERFKTELITNVSHDIKTPLTSIINYVDLLEKEEIPNENAKEYLEVLERQSARLKKLIEDLIEASKASSGSLSVNLEKLEAGVFLVQTVGEFKEKTEKSKLDLQIKKPEEPIYIMADGRHFWRVIDNLMNNICKYAQPETRVYINLDQTEEKVQITFRNTSRYALNISSEELMERFVRGDSSRNTEGNGLGLSIAGSLMELMHGKMQLFVDGDLFKVILEFDRCEA